VEVAIAGEETKYPDLHGQWTGILRRVPGLPGQPSFDPSKPAGNGQEAPLTPEYQAILEANLKRRRRAALATPLALSASVWACRV
jgi:hypothetical protein